MVEADDETAKKHIELIEKAKKAYAQYSGEQNYLHKSERWYCE